MEWRALGRDPKLSRRMVWTLLGLVALYGGVLAYLVGFAVLWAFFGGPVFGLVAFVPVALALGALGSFNAALRLTGARVVTPTEEPLGHAALARLCALADVPKPRLAVAPSDAPDAFAVGVRQSRSVIVVTRGLLNRLDPAELEAVLAHELAHVVNRDGAVMTVASYPVFAGAWLAKKASLRPGPVLALLVVWPYVLVGTVLYFVCRELTGGLSRCRELSADRGAAVLTGKPEALASALQKIGGALALIPEADLRQIAPLNALCIVPVDVVVRTHPPLAERLAQLAEMTRSIAAPDERRASSFPFAAAAFVSAFIAALLVFLYVG
jgi:heat shock protein HtpX